MSNLAEHRKHKQLCPEGAERFYCSITEIAEILSVYVPKTF